MTIERRAFGPCEVAEVPEERATAKKKGKKISGYAAVFNQVSEDLGGFREVIMPGAFDRALREGHDVRALVNHNPDLILGRTTAETLDLAIDDHGLRVEIFPPGTQIARDLLESIGRGDVSGMSFSFRVIPGGDDWRTEGDQVIREVRDVELFDVSPVAFPAYPQTQVDARAVDMARSLRAAPPVAEVPMAVNELQAAEWNS